MNDIFNRLESTIATRRMGDPSDSYVAKLRHKGRAEIAKKLGEEGVELAIAAVQDDGPKVVSESADVLFHMLMLLADMGLTLDDVCAELERREGLSGITEKAARRD